MKTDKQTITATNNVTSIKKTVLTLAAGALMLLSSFQSFAATPETIGKAAKENVRREIIREITCPDFVTENSEANNVKALLSVDEFGKITVYEVNSANVALKKYVTDTLKEMKIRNGEAIGKFILIVKFRVG